MKLGKNNEGKDLMAFEICGERKEGEANSKYAYRLLRKNIMSFRLVPGEALDEMDISDQLGMSRTPVREAMILLKNEKLVDILPQKGSKVSYIDLNLVRQGYFTRRVIESEIFKENAGALSVEQLHMMKQNLEAQEQEIRKGTLMSDYFFELDNDLHQMLYSFSSKQEIWLCLHNIGAHYERVRYLDTKANDINQEQILEEHRQIYYYMMMGIPDDVDVNIFMTGHLGRFRKDLPQKIETYPDYFLG